MLGIVLIFRLVYGAQLGMAQDETYYWQWSRHLAVSYYDQGPGIAYVIRFGTLLLGDTPLGIRLGNILLSIGSGWFLYAAMRRWTDARIALWTLFLLNVAPLIAAGSILATYDGPQVFFWAASLCALTWTAQENRRRGWYLVGLLVGLGLLCKLTMLLFAPGVLLFLLTSPRYRRWLATPHPWLAFALALVLFTPVLYWNATHGWMGFLHTVTLGSRRQDAAPFRWFGDFLGGQAGIALGPLLFLAELWAVGRLTANLIRSTDEATATERFWGVSRDAARFVVSFAAPTLAVCLILSLKSKLELNWPVPAHLTGIAAVAIWFAAAWNRGAARRERRWISATVALSAVIGFLAFFPGAPALLGIQISSSLAQKLNETYGWPEIMTRVQAARATLERENKPVFLCGVNYRVNSAVAFGLPDHPQTNALYLRSRRDQYTLWTHPQQLVGQNAVLCFDARNEDAVALARLYFDSVTLFEIVEPRRKGFIGPVKHWEIYLCRNFKGYDPLAHVDGY